MNDVDLERRLRTAFQAVAERDVAPWPVAQRLGAARNLSARRVLAGAVACAVVAGAIVFTVAFGPRNGPSLHPASPPGPTVTTTPTPPAVTLPTVTINHWTGREPAAIYFSGDAGDIATGLTWSRWDATGAVGHGTRNELGCIPDCAQGSSTPYPVTITMSNPVDGKFTTIVEQTSDGRGTTETFAAPDLGQGACATGDQASCA